MVNPKVKEFTFQQMEGTNFLQRIGVPRNPGNVQPEQAPQAPAPTDGEHGVAQTLVHLGLPSYAMEEGYSSEEEDHTMCESELKSDSSDGSQGSQIPHKMTSDAAESSARGSQRSSIPVAPSRAQERAERLESAMRAAQQAHKKALRAVQLSILRIKRDIMALKVKELELRIQLKELKLDAMTE